MSVTKKSDAASGKKRWKPWQKNLIFALVVLAVAAALYFGWRAARGSKGTGLEAVVDFGSGTQVVVYVVVDRPNVEEQADSSYAQYIAQAILDEILPYMNIYPDEETEETTKLWDGFKGVLRLDDSEVEVNEPIVQTEGSETGTDNAQDIEVVQDESGSSEEYNDEESDGVASENAGYEEPVSEDVSDEVSLIWLGQQTVNQTT